MTLIDPITLLAFVPQFVDPARGPLLPQFLLLGLILSTGGLIVNCAVGVFAGGIGRGMARSLRFGAIPGWISASAFTAPAVRHALRERS